MRDHPVALGRVPSPHLRQSMQFQSKRRAQDDDGARNVYEKADFYVDKRYQVVSVLGKGSYGTVCSAVDLQSRGKPSVAIKKVSDIFSREVLLKRAIRELKLLAFFKGHRHIVGLVDLDIVYLRPYDGLYCVQELVDYDLARVIHSSVQLSPFHIQSFLYQILCGLKYLHSADVIHRDLKPGNILVTTQGVLKICDFGLARGIHQEFLKAHHKTQITHYVATRWYRAPELILSLKSYGKPVDLWAVGCILGELYGRRPLFIGKDQIHQITEICKVLGSPPRKVVLSYESAAAWDFFGHSRPAFARQDWQTLFPHASATACNLLSQLVCWESATRLTADQALENPFFDVVRNPDEEVCAKEPFDFSYEWKTRTLDQLKECLVDEVARFRAGVRTRVSK